MTPSAREMIEATAHDLTAFACDHRYESVCQECAVKEMETVYSAGFLDGLRRAQEIAHGHDIAEAAEEEIASEIAREEGK
jgi:hypothetical protein